MAFGAADAHMGAGEAGGVFQEWSSEFHERGSTQGEDNFSQRVFKVQALAGFGSLNDSDQPVDDWPGWLMRRVLFRGDARAREFPLHRAPSRLDGAIKTIGGVGRARLAGAPAGFVRRAPQAAFSANAPDRSRGDAPIRYLAAGRRPRR